jgi:cholest-4-en-3-one 26-monooxygenase
MVDNDPLKTWTLGAEGLVDHSIRLARRRRAEPRDDFASVLTQAKIDGDVLSEHEMRSWFAALILGGFETTRNAIGVTYWKLLENPADAEAVLDDPLLMAGAFEESIRWASPSRHLMRVSTQDQEIAGVQIRANDWVVPYLASASRDESVFDEPDRYDIRRAPNPHLGFGDGVHKCLGRHLSRLEVITAVPAMLRAFSGAEIAGNPVWATDTLSGGLISLPIRRVVAGAAR